MCLAKKRLNIQVFKVNKMTHFNVPVLSRISTLIRSSKLYFLYFPHFLVVCYAASIFSSLSS